MSRRKYKPDPYAPFPKLEKFLYEAKPAMLLGFLAFVHSSVNSVALGKFCLVLLMASAAIIIYSRLEYRGYLKR